MFSLTTQAGHSSGQAHQETSGHITAEAITTADEAERFFKPYLRTDGAAGAAGEAGETPPASPVPASRGNSRTGSNRSRR